MAVVSARRQQVLDLPGANSVELPVKLNVEQLWTTDGVGHRPRRDLRHLFGEVRMNSKPRRPNDGEFMERKSSFL